MIKKGLNYLGALLLIALVFSCSSEDGPQIKVDVNVDHDESKECSYTYNADSSSLNWTAFKTNDRVAVGGSFDSLEVVLLEKEFTSPTQMLESASFKVYTSSVFTNNSIRDNTLRNYFFSKLDNEGLITGNFKIVEGDDQSGGGVVSIDLNGVKRDVGYEYAVDIDGISIKTQINLVSFSGQEAVQSLNKECDELHKGADGISKLWPEVEIVVKVVLDKKCD